MMIHRVLFVAVLPLVIAGCRKPVPTTQPDAGAMGGTAIPAGGKLAHGTGAIKAIDPVAGTITLEHGPVTELQWPAMTMGFSGTLPMLSGLAVGDRVDFAFSWDGKAGRLVSIRKK